MSVCFPVQLNDPWTMKKKQNQRKGTIINFSIPWSLVALKLVLVLLALCNINLEATPTSNGAFLGLMLFQLPSFAFDITMFIIVMDADPCNNEAEYSDATKDLVVAYIIRCCILFGGIAYCAAADIISYIYLLATLGYIVVEFIFWRQHRKHFILQFKKMEDGLLEKLKRKYGRDHQLGEKVICDFSLVTANQEETFWNGTPYYERNHSILPENLFCQSKDGRDEFFVDWNAYSDVNNRIKSNFQKMNSLFDKNEELRNDLIRQNQVISQMKRKIYGPKVDCYEHNQLPNSPHAVAGWYPAMAEGVFTVHKLTTELYVKLDDYREMANHSLVLKESIYLLEEEMRFLVGALQARKTINDVLVAKWLNGEVKEEAEIELTRLDDVD